MLQSVAATLNLLQPSAIVSLNPTRLPGGLQRAALANPCIPPRLHNFPQPLGCNGCFEMGQKQARRLNSDEVEGEFTATHSPGHEGSRPSVQSLMK